MKDVWICPLVGRRNSTTTKCHNLLESKTMSASKDLKQLAWECAPSDVFVAVAFDSKGAPRYSCRLCRIDNISITNLSKHRENDIHKQMASELDNFQRKWFLYVAKMIRNAKLYEDEILQLANPSWQAQLRSQLFPYHEIDFYSPPSERLPNFFFPLKQFMHLEKVSLLEQAAWKHAILVNKFDGGDGIAGAIFYKTGWKEHKAEMRRHSAIGVIVRGVIPFLDKL